VDASWAKGEARRLVEEQIPLEKIVVKDIHFVRTVSNRKDMFCVKLELSRDFLIHDVVDEPESKRSRLE